MDSTDVPIGSVWYVWGDHQKVVEEREGRFGREVRLQRMGRARDKQPWVEVRRVLKYGVPSTYYSKEGAS
jgi:hypothetical protein